MNVELVTIGDELLLGFTLDTNGAHLARELAAWGMEVARRTSVGDSAVAIGGAVRDALDRTGAVITTGGLGPTSDDLTKPSIAAIFGREMSSDDTIIEGLRQRWASRGWPGQMPESNAQQAMIPEGAVILPNGHGTAPGIWLEDDRGRWVAMLPGVPREMRGMLADELLPRLRARLTGTPNVVASLTLRLTGLGESAVADRLTPLPPGLDGLSLAYLPGWEGVDLRLTSSGRPAAASERALASGAAALRSVLGGLVYGEDGTDLADVVLRACRERGYRIAVAESCTGGMLGARLTAVPGSSSVMLGGVIAYANEVKESQLGVSAATLQADGAVSEEVSREMASGVRSRFGADVGVGITGIAGPDGSTPDKPVGTICIAVDIRGEVQSARTTTVGDRGEIRQRAGQAALNMLRRALVEPN